MDSRAGAAGARRRDPLGGDRDATRWAGYIDGAVSSGERAATEVLAAL